MSARSTGHAQHGQVLSEFALVVPLLLTMLLGVLEGGVATYSMVSLDHGTREAARYAILGSSTSASTVRQKVRDNAYLLTIPDANITITTMPAAGGSACPTDACYAARQSGDYVAVSTTYTYNGLIAMVFGPGASFVFTARSELRSE